MISGYASMYIHGKVLCKSHTRQHVIIVKALSSAVVPELSNEGR